MVEHLFFVQLLKILCFQNIQILFNVSLVKFLKFNFELKAPIKLSPAAVVSTAFTLNDFTNS